MRYLITFNDQREPFITKWYDYENNWIDGMVIFDLALCKYSTDGMTWIDIEQDHL